MLIQRETVQKESYTRVEDEIIVAEYNRTGKVADVVKALASKKFDRTKLSVQYRIRKLRTYKSFDDINYDGKKGK